LGRCYEEDKGNRGSGSITKEKLMKFKLTEIETIERKHHKGKVYDLTIAEDHSYTIEGVVVHNSICSTRIQTGHGVPGLQTIIDCSRTDRKVTIIADGGIRNSGDMVKAFACGADAVMCGSLLAGTDETPGKVTEDANGSRWKTYRGMASKEAQVSWRGNYSSHEGVSATVPYRGSVTKILEDLERGIRSGFSYSGARSLKEFQSVAKLLRQTPAGMGESRTHIVGRKW
jgi:IMP dehydrogenase